MRVSIWRRFGVVAMLLGVAFFWFCVAWRSHSEAETARRVDDMIMSKLQEKSPDGDYMRALFLKWVAEQQKKQATTTQPK